MKLHLGLAFLIALPIWASPRGDSAGNSGHGVVCKINGVETHHLLDYFENGFVPDLGEGDVAAQAAAAISRLTEKDPQRKVRYLKVLSDFFTHVEWVKQGDPLSSLDDSGLPELPLGCELEQLAIRAPFHPSLKTYLIDQRLWDKLSVADQAGLVLHEIIYAEMHEMGQRNSRRSRIYNRLISSLEVEGLTQNGYEETVTELFVYGPVFRSLSFDINVIQGEPYHLSLRSLLQHTVPGRLQWFLLNPHPYWAEIVDSTEELVALASEIPSKLTDVSLLVSDGETSAIARLRIRVKPPLP